MATSQAEEFAWEKEIRRILARAKVPTALAEDFVDCLRLQSVFPHNPFYLTDYSAKGVAQNRQRLSQLYAALSVIAEQDPSFLENLIIWHAPDDTPHSVMDWFTPEWFKQLADAVKAEIHKCPKQRGRPKDSITLAHVSWIVHLWVYVLELKPSPNRGSHLFQIVTIWLKYNGWALEDCRRYIRKAIALLSPPKKRHRGKIPVTS